MEFVTGRTAADRRRNQRRTYQRFLWQHCSDRPCLSDFVQGRPKKVGVDENKISYASAEGSPNSARDRVFVRRA